jgi:hypothetical protein
MQLPGQIGGAAAEGAENVSAALDIEAMTRAVGTSGAETGGAASATTRATESEPGAARLLVHCNSMLHEAKKMHWVMKRLTGYLGRCELVMTIVLATVPAISAAAHSLLTIESFEHSHTIMAALAGIQTMIVGLNSHLKLGHRLSEAKVVGAGLESLVADLQVAASGTLNNAELKEQARACEKKIKETLALSSSGPPQWVIKEAEKVLGLP